MYITVQTMQIIGQLQARIQVQTSDSAIVTDYVRVISDNIELNWNGCAWVNVCIVTWKTAYFIL